LTVRGAAPAPSPAGGTGRSVTEKDFAYDRIWHVWGSLVSRYDTDRRIEVLVGDFIENGVAGKRCLDAGTGLGFFAQELDRRGAAEVVAIDIGPSLVERLQALLPSADCRVADMMDLEAALGGETFDVIVCSEAIEHTPQPRLAVLGLARRLRPGGLLSLSCPNRAWRWLLSVAQAIGLRKHYTGYENWVGAGEMRRWLEEAGLELLRAEGVHLVPWQLVPKALLRPLDVALRRVSFRYSVNLAVLARKTS
jgi:2-polyprenyl-6-hydroxyphenyl methylase/3-demethylubiquinone-9 3-methyltransferase